MYKLLTEEEKKIVSREYKLRRTAVILSAIILVSIVQLAGLFPSRVLSNSREREVNERLTLLNNMEFTEEERSLFSWMNNFNLRLKVLSPHLDTDRPSGLIEGVIEARTNGIRIIGFDWLREDNVEALTITGVASDRQTLTLFERSIEDAGLGDATLPVSNLANDRNITFTLKLVPTKRQ